MSAPVAVDDWEQWTPHALVVVFGALVAAILAAVPGWSAPLHAWIALTGVVSMLLTVHAGARAVARAACGRWRGAAISLLLAGALGASGVLLMKVGPARMTTLDEAMSPAPAESAGSAR